MTVTRRRLLSRTLEGAALLAAAPFFPAFLAQAAAALRERRRGPRILVVVELTGGNDGLNTVVPFADDHYHRLRPTLALAPRQVLRLTDTLGFHPALTGLKALYDRGELAVVENVGYPNPNRSHFRSMDIWQTGATEDRRHPTGWLGRAAARMGGSGPKALQVGSGPLRLALRNTGVAAPVVPELEALRLEPDTAALAPVLTAPASGGPPELAYVTRVLAEAFAAAGRLRDVAPREQRRRGFPGYGLAHRLADVAALIRADLDVRIFYTALGSFDTHARQAPTHAALLRELGASIAAFFAALRRDGLADRVLLMTFSEFGRRAAENAGQGTDHGAAAPLFLVGPAVRPGIHGGAPDLARLRNGDLVHRIDFRSVYAAVLEQWLELPAAQVLGDAFQPVPLLRSL